MQREHKKVKQQQKEEQDQRKKQKVGVGHFLDIESSVVKMNKKKTAAPLVSTHVGLI